MIAFWRRARIVRSLVVPQAFAFNRPWDVRSGVAEENPQIAETGAIASITIAPVFSLGDVLCSGLSSSYALPPARRH